MQTLVLESHQQAVFDIGKGVPVVLLHGYPLDHSMWQAQIEALSDRCRVIAPDLRGFGQSTLAAGDEQQGVAMETYARDVAQVLDELQVTEPVVLAGFSMGGYVLWQFVRQFPDRVRAIIPCDTRALADTSDARQGRITTAESIAATGIAPVAEAMLPKLLCEATRASHPEVVAQVQAIMHRCTPAAVAAALRGMADRPDVTATLPTMQYPALVLVGAEDAISTPSEMRTIAQQLPQARFVEIANAGHMTPCENPSAVSAALRDFIGALR